MNLEGGCHCGAVRYEIVGDPVVTMICHCADCRRSAGAPMVCWTTVPETAFRLIRGNPKIRASSADGRRAFCGDCGTGLYYRNARMLPGMTDVQTATLDDPEATPPTLHMQAAERLGWVEQAHRLPSFDRFPPPE